MIHLVHWALALTLFGAINWIGSHAKPSGYISLSVFVKKDEAPAFNFLFRVLGPIVFVVIVAAVFYWLNWDRLVEGIWRVVLYHLAFRLAFNLVLNRALLLNWGREVLIWATSLAVVVPLYGYVISVRQYLLPDAQSVTNELWVIVVLFIYSTLNNIQLKPEASAKRKGRYLRNSYKALQSKYHNVVEYEAPDLFAESIIYTIMVYESFNRPRAVQFVEHLLFPWYSRTLGPMQVKTKNRLSAVESVRLGARRVAASYQRARKHVELYPNYEATGELSDDQVLWEVAAEYNRDDNYVRDIRELNSMVLERFYPGLYREPGVIYNASTPNPPLQTDEGS